MTSTPASSPLRGPEPRSEAGTSGSTPDPSEAVSEAYSASEARTVAEARVAELEATLGRARALAEEWYNLADDNEDEHPAAARVLRADSLALHAVLDGPQAQEAPGA